MSLHSTPERRPAARSGRTRSLVEKRERGSEERDDETLHADKRRAQCVWAHDGSVTDRCLRFAHGMALDVALLAVFTLPAMVIARLHGPLRERDSNDVGDAAGL